MGDASGRAVWAMVREQFRLAERTAAMTAQVLVPRTQKNRPCGRLSKREQMGCISNNTYELEVLQK